MVWNPIIRVAVAHLCGLVLGAAARYFPITAAMAAGLGVGAWFLSSKSSPFRWKKAVPAVLMVLLGAIHLISVNRPDRADENFLMRFGPGPVTIRGQIDSAARHRPGRTPEEPETTVLAVRLGSVRIDEGDVPVSGRLRLTVAGFRPGVGYGDRIEITAAPGPITGFRNPGGFDYAGFLHRRGFVARAAIHRPGDLLLVQKGGNPVLRTIYRWRERVRRAMTESLSPESAGLLQAMIIGETGNLRPEIREKFMSSGTAHILSISGSHLSLVALLVFGGAVWILRRMPSNAFLRMSRRIRARPMAALVTVFPVFFYALLAGGGTATVRSLIMILAYLGSVWMTRRHEALHALAIAFLIVTIPDPNAVFDISFQLSYGAVLAMSLIVRKFTVRGSEPRSRIQSAGIRIKTAFLITAAAGLGTAPLVAYHFNQFSWVGLISNLIVTPLVGLLVVPSGLIGAVGVVATQSDTLPAAWFQETVVRLLIKIVSFFASLPLAEIHVPSPPVTVIILWYASGWYWVRFSGSRDRRQCLKAAVCIALTLPWILGAGTAGAARPLRITFLDVGQGDSAWVEFPDGRTMLIDGGGRAGSYDAGRLAIAPYLWDRSVRKIDTVVMTHPQLDHAGGLVYLLRKFQTGEIWTNGAYKNARFYRDLLQEARDRRIPVRHVDSGWGTVKTGRSSIEVLHPGESPGGFSDNDLSLVLRLRQGRVSILFTGDIESPAEAALLLRGEPLVSTVVKVPHHGSRTSILPRFLAQICPQAAVISVGRANRFGHPAPEALEAYGILGSRLWRTDRDGAVMIETDGERIRYSSYRDSVLLPVEGTIGIRAGEVENLIKVWRAWWGVYPA